MLPQLFQPSSVEIQTVAASAKRRHPELSSRIDKAAGILTTGGLQLRQEAWELRSVPQWRINSQSHGGAYVVCGLQCPCQDKRVKFCKHAIAVSLYMKILANRLNQDIRRFDVELGILPDRTFTTYAKGLGICTLKKVGTAYTFTDPASAVRYAMYLAKREAAKAIPVNWPQPVAVAA